MSNPNRITAGSAARLFVYAYDSTTLLPYTTLVYSDTFSTKNSQQRIGGVWQTGVSLGTILDGASDNVAVAAGTFVKHTTGDGLNNLYSIDVASAQVTNAGGVDAIRLQLAVTGVVFVPVVHTIDVAGITLATPTNVSDAQAAIVTQVDTNETKIDALTAELAKIPKSDSNVTWNATAAAQIQSEANDALVAYAVATAAQINSLQINTRANIQVPIEIETPDSGSTILKIRLFLFDVDGNMEAPDSEPTITLVNSDGTSRASRLSTATQPIGSTGQYFWNYTNTYDDPEEQLCWQFTVIEGGLTRVYPATSFVVEETAYRFTATDRNTLNAAATQVSVDNLPAVIWNDDWSSVDFPADTPGGYIQRGYANIISIVSGGVKLADNVVHGGSTAKLRLGSSDITPAFWVTNDSSDNGHHAVHFCAGNGISGGAGMLISGGGVTPVFLTPCTEGLYVGGSGVATSSALSTLQTAWNTFTTGGTNIFNWLRRFARKDAGTAAMGTAETEINTGGTSTYVGTTDNLESLNDSSSGGSAEAIATAILLADWTTLVGVVPDRCLLNAQRHIRNKWTLEGTTKSVYAEDNTTVAFTTVVTTDELGNITGDTPN